MSDDDLFYRIGKIALKPGEILVLKSPDWLTEQDIVNIRVSVGAALRKAGHPDQAVMILCGGLDLVVIDPSDFGEPKAA